MSKTPAIALPNLTTTLASPTIDYYRAGMPSDCRAPQPQQSHLNPSKPNCTHASCTSTAFPSLRTAFHDAANCPSQLYAHNDPSYTYSSLPHFLSSAVSVAAQLALLGRLTSFPCVKNVPKHSRTSSTTRSGASHAGRWLGFWCRFTHATSHEPEPHISGVALLLLRA